MDKKDTSAYNKAADDMLEAGIKCLGDYARNYSDSKNVMIYATGHFLDAVQERENELKDKLLPEDIIKINDLVKMIYDYIMAC